MTASAVPAVLDALLAGLRGWPPLDGVQILDALPAQVEALEEDTIVIGGAQPQVPGADSQQERRGLDPRRRRERVIVSCAVSCWTGDSDEAAIRGRRDRAYALLDEVQSFLGTDSTLGGVVIGCQLGEDMTYVPAQTPSGAEVSVGFQITAIAEI